MNPFAGTTAEMTWNEVHEAAERGAVALWAIGVLEQHGPHLPVATDVYVPMEFLRNLQAKLADERVEAVILPPFYWGINVVSSGFPTSYSLSASTMQTVLGELILSITHDGFRHLFCLSGHGDAQHNISLHAAITQVHGQALESGTSVHHVLDERLAQRIGVRSDDPGALVLPAADTTADSSTWMDLHAGDWETSVMLAGAPELVRHAYRDLPDSAVGGDGVARWRLGGEEAKAVTPLGYLGNPSTATAHRGEQLSESFAQRATTQIVSIPNLRTINAGHKE